MKVVLSFLIVFGAFFGAYKLWEHYEQVKEGRAQTRRVESGTDVEPEKLPGLPVALEHRLREAQQRGPEALAAFLEQIKPSPLVSDPRLAWIELDYVVMISGSQPLEARRRFAAVRRRTPPDSPVFGRVQALEKNYR